MSKRLVVVGSATAVAGLVLGASIVFGPPAVTGSKNAIDGQVTQPGIDGNRTGNPQDLSARIQGFDYRLFEVGDDGEVRNIRIRARRSNLKAMGINELLDPHVDIRLGAQRAITITADEVDLKTENGKPRAGQFSGNVVVTLFQAPVGAKLVIDREDPEHAQFVQQRIYLDDSTDFDIEDNRINTRGPVHVTSSQVDFFGIGLRLTYNNERQRIEQLLINEGRYLLFNPDADSPAFDSPATAEAEKNTGEDADDDKEQPAWPSQYYIATFADNVVVRDGIESELGGDLLAIDFSLGTEAVKPKPVTPRSSARPSVTALPYGRLAQADANDAPESTDANADAPVLPVVVIPQTNADRSLFTHDPERDLVVTWTGELSVIPHLKKPDALADDNDAQVTLTGEHAYAQTTRDGELERLETTKLVYLVAEERTDAFGTLDKPVRIVSDGLGGEITATKLTVRPQDAAATVMGPGTLSYSDEKKDQSLDLQWANRLDLELYTEDRDAKTKAALADDTLVKNELVVQNKADDDEKLRTQTKMLGVKTATFDQDVKADHTDFNLETDKLTLTFLKPDKKAGIKNDPSNINAQGNINIQARGKDDEQFEIGAQGLTIELTPHELDKEPYASRILAKGKVNLVRPGMNLDCDHVSVDLLPPNKDKQALKQAKLAEPEAEAEAGKQADSLAKLNAEVSIITATGNVRAEIDDEGRRVDLVADQLIGDVERDRLTLSANNALRPAEFVQFDPDKRVDDKLVVDHKITGKVIIMDRRAQKLSIPDVGSLAKRISDPDNPDATIEDSFLNIAWDGSMWFNNITSQAEFNENVRSESRRSTDTSELFCDKLEMTFSPDYEHDAARLVEDEGEDAHERQIRKAVASGNVKFMAAAWEFADPDKVTNRMRLEGPSVVFTNQPAVEIGGEIVETVVVDGRGTMVIEDYRVPAKPDKAAKENQDRAFMTGRGATLFSWNQSMTLDAQTNTATLLDTVQMVHIPKDENDKEGDTVQLDCNKLVADMVDNGGLSVWLSEDAPDTQVTTITADDNVRLLQNKVRSMRGDHMKFSAENNLVELWTNPGRDVLIQDLKRDTTTYTNKVSLDLVTDRITIDELRGGVAPLE